jgi:ribosomal protein S18 acetylase RimI-like enzyme
MKLLTLPKYLKKLMKDFITSLTWNETIVFRVRYRDLSQSLFKLKDRGVSCRIATLKEIISLLKRRKIDFIDYHERIKLNHKCFIAKVEGSDEIAGYGWVAVNKYRFPQTLLKIHFKKHEAYVYNLYTFPKFRGRGIAPRITHKALEYLITNNYKKLYTLFSTTNPAMMLHAVPKYRKLRLTHHLFKPLKPFIAKPRNPFLQDLFDLFYILRHFKSVYWIYFEGTGLL